MCTRGQNHNRNAENWCRKIDQNFKTLVNKIIDERKILQDWYNSELILIFNKRNTENYRAISILSHFYKLLTKIITNRLTNKLDYHQPVEQAGLIKNQRYGILIHIEAYFKTTHDRTSYYEVFLFNTIWMFLL